MWEEAWIQQMTLQTENHSQHTQESDRERERKKEMKEP